MHAMPMFEISSKTVKKTDILFHKKNYFDIHIQEITGCSMHLSIDTCFLNPTFCFILELNRVTVIAGLKLIVQIFKLLTLLP